MKSLTDHLHDEVDEIERLREKARDMAEQLVRDRLGAAFDGTAEIEAALASVAMEVEDGLTDTTTEALQSMARLAAKRPR